MSDTIEVLQEYLRREGYVLCRASDTQWGLEEAREVEVLRTLVETTTNRLQSAAETVVSESR